MKVGEVPAGSELRGGSEFRLTGLTSSERAAHTFRLIAAPPSTQDVDEVSETGGDTLGTTVPKDTWSWIRLVEFNTAWRGLSLAPREPRTKAFWRWSSYSFGSQMAVGKLCLR